MRLRINRKLLSVCVIKSHNIQYPTPLRQSSDTKMDNLTNSSDVCMTFRRSSKFLPNSFEGIPETLLLNVIGWIIFILLFSVLRQQAWDYGRLALVSTSSDNKRWTQLFYAHTSDDTGGGSGAGTTGMNSERNSRRNTANGGSTATINSTTSNTTAGPSGMDMLSGSSSTSIHDTIQRSSSQSTHNKHHVDRGFLSWIPATLRLKKDQILEHSGPDAVHYLSFQQHLMCVMAIITFISMFIVLPINSFGSAHGDVWSFGHSTISNLDTNSLWLWIHVFIAIAYVPLVVLIMRRASGRNAFKTAASRTVMISDISRSERCKNKAQLRNYVQELFPDYQIDDFQLAYNASKLMEVVKEYERVSEARKYCEIHRNHRPVRAMPKIYTCQTVDGYEYYKGIEMRLEGEVARLRVAAMNEPVGIAFLTVNTTDIAKRIIGDFNGKSDKDWSLSYAPAPSDLFWENLNISASKWYIKWFIVNSILFLFLFFLTTPVLIVNILNNIAMVEKTTDKFKKISPLISEFLPTLLLWTLAALLPVIVTFSDKWLSHWTRSKQNYSIMTKTFGYLLFMILILPSMGLTSAQALLEWTFNHNDSDTDRWTCIFLPDKGAFFVNYIITAALIGTALELLRFPELIVYIYQLCIAKSRAETSHIRKSILIEFPFGIHYAWTVLVFTMSTVYSVICPLITPFAMIYICLKHFGDRHNLYFAYGPSNMISQSGGRIHSTAVTMTKFSVVLLL